MAGLSYDPTARVQGPDATLTIAGIAVGLVVGMLRPGWAIGSAVVGVVLLVVGLLVKKRPVQLVGRLGLGLAVGAGLLYAFVALNLLHPIGH